MTPATAGRAPTGEEETVYCRTVAAKVSTFTEQLQQLADVILVSRSTVRFNGCFQQRPLLSERYN